MSGTIVKYIGKGSGDFWFRYNQKPTVGGPVRPDNLNLQSLHIIESAEDTEV